jgi:hypothetical protein
VTSSNGKPGEELAPENGEPPAEDSGATQVTDNGSLADALPLRVDDSVDGDSSCNKAPDVTPPQIDSKSPRFVLRNTPIQRDRHRVFPSQKNLERFAEGVAGDIHGFCMPLKIILERDRVGEFADLIFKHLGLAGHAMQMEEEFADFICESSMLRFADLLREEIGLGRLSSGQALLLSFDAEGDRPPRLFEEIRRAISSQTDSENEEYTALTDTLREFDIILVVNILCLESAANYWVDHAPEFVWRHWASSIIHRCCDTLRRPPSEFDVLSDALEEASAIQSSDDMDAEWTIYKAINHKFREATYKTSKDLIDSVRSSLKGEGDGAPIFGSHELREVFEWKNNRHCGAVGQTMLLTAAFLPVGCNFDVYIQIVRALLPDGAVDEEFLPDRDLNALISRRMDARDVGGDMPDAISWSELLDKKCDTLLRDPSFGVYYKDDEYTEEGSAIEFTGGIDCRRIIATNFPSDIAALYNRLEASRLLDQPDRKIAESAVKILLNLYDASSRVSDRHVADALMAPFRDAKNFDDVLARIGVLPRVYENVRSALQYAKTDERRQSLLDAIFDVCMPHLKIIFARDILLSSSTINMADARSLMGARLVGTWQEGSASGNPELFEFTFILVEDAFHFLRNNEEYEASTDDVIEIAEALLIDHRAVSSKLLKKEVCERFQRMLADLVVRGFMPLERQYGLSTDPARSRHRHYLVEGLINSNWKDEDRQYALIRRLLGDSARDAHKNYEALLCRHAAWSQSDRREAIVNFLSCRIEQVFKMLMQGIPGDDVAWLRRMENYNNVWKQYAQCLGVEFGIIFLRSKDLAGRALDLIANADCDPVEREQVLAALDLYPAALVADWRLSVAGIEKSSINSESGAKVMAFYDALRKAVPERTEGIAAGLEKLARIQKAMATAFVIEGKKEAASVLERKAEIIELTCKKIAPAGKSVARRQ